MTADHAKPSRRRVTVAEVIATHVGWDVSEVREYRYQPGMFRTALYNIGDFYYAVPLSPKHLPTDWRWHDTGLTLGRTVFRAHYRDDVQKCEA